MGYCPECGFRISPVARKCAYCGNTKFYMTVRVFWDECDSCKPVNFAGAGRRCTECSGKGYRKYRLLKDARTGSVYLDQSARGLQEYRELREGKG